MVMLGWLFLATPALALSPECKATGKTCPAATKKSIFLPECVYHEGNATILGTAKVTEGGKTVDKNLTVEQCCGCRDVNTFLQLAVQVVNWVFTIVGAVALVVFIYGGFMMLTSAGSEEKVKKGRDALVAAVIGLAIMFSANLIIRFVLESAVPGGRLEAGNSLNVDITKPPTP